MSVVCAWIFSQWKLRTALSPTLRGSHLSADAWSPQQSERSVASPICSTTGQRSFNSCVPVSLFSETHFDQWKLSC
ncbi:hypothetical protein EXN66_Car002342 [Channa argus]|uniref:Uncharacterized protein n=1 Tax=Channa argus TaxID=215402 RepID=A0A6G1P8P3_CHAAH|nr:hypothetical protein EXN66_Car002342 [Channa argus]